MKIWPNGCGARPAYQVLGGQAVAKLVGRRDECDALDRLVADVLAGASRVLILRGDAGAGKSALLGYLSGRLSGKAGRGDGWRVVSAAGMESEMDLAYSGLHQLCAPLLDHLGELPPPRHDALAIVFGLSAGPASDRFLVGLAAGPGEDLPRRGARVPVPAPRRVRRRRRRIPDRRPPVAGHVPPALG
jgi:hypothetical protein